MEQITTSKTTTSTRTILSALLLMTSLASIILKPVQAHGYLKDPPARNVAGPDFGIPRNHDPSSLNCGGMWYQTLHNDKCGICGDGYGQPRLHEAGGKYANGPVIVKTYRQGETFTATYHIKKNHWGKIWLKICSADGLDSKTEVTQECLDAQVLTEKLISGGDKTDQVVSVTLPHGLTCDRCVLQWKYRAANNSGSDQEEFVNCADIRIV